MKWISTWAGLAAAALMCLAFTVEASADEVRRYNYATNSWETVSSDTARGRTVLRHKRPDPKYNRTQVRIQTNQAPGTIIVDSRKKFLYFVEKGGTATRYGVGVGKEGFSWSGRMIVGRKAEWPGWTPPKAMIARERKKGRILPAYMEGGPANPLGARALYLYRGGRDSLFRIHGTNQPWTIGREMSSGCIRMMNEDVTHLYSRVPNGTRVIVIGPNGQNGKGVYADLGPVGGRNLLADIFGG